MSHSSICWSWFLAVFRDQSVNSNKAITENCGSCSSDSMTLRLQHGFWDLTSLSGVQLLPLHICVKAVTRKGITGKSLSSLPAAVLGLAGPNFRLKIIRYITAFKMIYSRSLMWGALKLLLTVPSLPSEVYMVCQWNSISIYLWCLNTTVSSCLLKTSEPLPSHQRIIWYFHFSQRICCVCQDDVQIWGVLFNFIYEEVSWLCLLFWHLQRIEWVCLSQMSNSFKASNLFNSTSFSSWLGNGATAQLLGLAKTSKHNVLRRNKPLYVVYHCVWRTY